eukprot:SAG22_NODE_21718_length_254_cov_1.238710_1_plen_41_part_10
MPASGPGHGPWHRLAPSTWPAQRTMAAAAIRVAAIMDPASP